MEQRPDNGRPQSRGVRLANASLVLGVAGLLLLPLVLAGFQRDAGRELKILGGLSALILCPLLGLTGAVLGVIALAVKGSTTRLRRWQALAGFAASVLTLLLALFTLYLFLTTSCGSC
jgi:hypothetical protein